MKYRISPETSQHLCPNIELIELKVDIEISNVISSSRDQKRLRG